MADRQDQWGLIFNISLYNPAGDNLDTINISFTTVAPVQPEDQIAIRHADNALNE